jgi:hypothetical protein
MKVKVKFDLASMKNWLFDHGEKVAFGAMALVFLLFVYSALNGEVLDATKQPEKLQEIARNATQHVADSKWDDKQSGVQVVDYQERAKRDALSLEKFPLATALNLPLEDPKGKRDDPAIFQVEDLRVAAGVGSFALKGATAAPGNQSRPSGPPGQAGRASTGGVRPTSSANLKTQAWVVITGLVPIDKQAKEYDRVFSHAQGNYPDRNAPHYSGVIVQRAEVKPASPDKLEWVDIATVDKFEEEWEVRGEETVAPPYVDPNLTSPLGPLVGRDWDESVAHPKVPYLGAAEEAPAASAEPAAAAQPPKAAAANPNRRAAPQAAPPQQAAPAAAGRPAPPQYKLLRVFDYKVEPLHRYRYRVKPELQNPNYNLPAKDLKNPGAPSSKQEFRSPEEWTAAAEPVTVPSGYDVLASGVESKSGEPAANLLLTAFEEGLPASTKAKLYRASVANKKESNVRATDPRNNQATVIDEVDFKTGMVVVDIYGGRTISLPKRRESPIAAPGEVLLFDTASGTLVVHSDLDDHPQCESRKPPEDTETATTKSDKDDSKKKSPRTKGK